MKINNYEQAVRYLESFIGKVRFRIDPQFLKHHDPLERMRTLLNLLDNPQDKFQSVLVGGTAGKGSTAYLISHILTTCGYKTGLTISPHLQRINERLQINEQQISDLHFSEMVKAMVPAIKLMGKMEVGAPSYFEIVVALAFVYFAKEKVDIAVVEVGMGGEFDATNTLYPLVSVLTNVYLDHTQILGNTVEEIARTKAGIIKKLKIKNKKLRIVSGVKQLSVIKIIEERCEKVGAKLFRLGEDFDFEIKKETPRGSIFDLILLHDRVTKLNDLRLSLLGDYQVENASLAIKTVLELEKAGFSVLEENIRQALQTAFFSGRFEIINLARQPHVADDARPALSRNQTALRSLSERRPQTERKSSFSSSASGLSRSNSQLTLDGAHNPTKMKLFTKSLQHLFPKHKKIFIIAFKRDKDTKEMLKYIVQAADRIIVTEFEAKTDMAINASADALNIKSQISSLRRSAAEALARKWQGFGWQANIKYDGKVMVEKDSGKALEKGLKIIQQPARNAESSDAGGSNSSAILVVTGSLYLVGEIRNKL